MKRFYAFLILIPIFATFLLAGCASTPDNLQRETARYIRDIHPDEVKITNIKRGATSVTWEADTPKGKYDCSGDDMVQTIDVFEKRPSEK